MGASVDAVRSVGAIVDVDVDDDDKSKDSGNAE